MIILNKRFCDVFIEPPKPKIQGFFRLYKGKAGQPRQKVAEFENLILDAGLNRLGDTSAITLCSVGTGNSAPSVTQTNLDARVADVFLSLGTHLFVDGTEPFTQGSFTARFGVGAAAGNLAEVGIGWGATGNVTLFSRALILDTNGVPTTITVLSDEYLDVEYVLRFYPPTTDSFHNVNISGVNYSVQSRAAAVSHLGYWRPHSLQSSGLAIRFFRLLANASLGTIYQFIGGTSVHTVTSITPNAYIQNSYSRSSTATVPLTTGNHQNGISGAEVYLAVNQNTYTASYQMLITPAIPKDETKTLVLTFNTSWARK